MLTSLVIEACLPLHLLCQIVSQCADLLQTFFRQGTFAMARFC